MSSCSRDTTSIKYSKNGLPILDDRHIVAYVAAREEVGEALLSSFCKPRGCTYEFIRLSTEELLRRVEEVLLLKDEGGYYYWRYSRCASNDEAKKSFYSCDKPTCKSYFKNC